eukprot:TRINITY_DN4476_c0_g1_i2.p1 TRINITY_DN4476_c0_g1~~TRINITY_DN4476_c0_g1_i2.p1  ORF type:complete len:469 (-),score=53.56 TRINITY_DN4476_c0_g1_i2:19-1425(-)
MGIIPMQKLSSCYIISLTVLLIALSITASSAAPLVESRELGKQCKQLPLVGKACIQINATGCGSMSIAVDLGNLAPKVQRSIGMLELMDQLRRRQAALISQGQPPFPVTECFDSTDYPATFCYNVTRFAQSSLRTGGAGNSVTLEVSIKAKISSMEYLFNFGTITIDGCDMLSCGNEPNLCSAHGTCSDFGCGCENGFWGPQCAFQSSLNGESSPCVQTSGGDQICPSISVDGPCQNLNIALNSNQGSESVSIPFASALSSAVKLKCIQNFLATSCESCTVVDRLSMGTTIVGARTLNGCVGVSINCPDSAPVTRTFQCDVQFIPVLPPSCENWVPTTEHHHGHDMPMGGTNPTPTPVVANSPSSDGEQTGAPNAGGGSKTRWMVIFFFLAMFVVGAGVLYWYARSRGGIMSLFSNKKEVYYVRQTDLGVPELEIADEVELDEDPSAGLPPRSKRENDHSDTVDVELQ